MPEPPHQDGAGCPGPQAVVVLPGQVDLSNADTVGEQLLAVISRGATVLIADMAATLSCDHAGADALARVYQRAVAHGTQLRLVIPVPAVRRVIALNGLDQLVPVFPTLEAAQAAHPLQAVVLCLPPRKASNGSAMLTHSDGPRPVSWLPVAGPASPGGSGHAAQQGMQRREFEDALARITNGIFQAGLTLQAGLGQPADGLRRAALRTLDLLDETFREARDAAFARHGHAADGLADADDPAAAVSLAAQAWPGPVKALGADASGPFSAAALAARSSQARSRELQARMLKAAVLSAATKERVAASLLQSAAASYPPHSVRRRALSQAVASHATRMRQWAHDHAATG